MKNKLKGMIKKETNLFRGERWLKQTTNFFKEGHIIAQSRSYKKRNNSKNKVIDYFLPSAHRENFRLYETVGVGNKTLDGGVQEKGICNIQRCTIPSSQRIKHEILQVPPPTP